MERKVYEIMLRRIYTISQSSTLEYALDFMNSNHIRSGFLVVVVDRNNNAIGVITRYDLRKVSFEEYPKTKVSEVMSTNFFTIPQDASISEAKKIFDEHKIGSISVTNESGKIIGIVTSDYVNRYINMNEAEQENDYASESQNDHLTEKESYYNESETENHYFDWLRDKVDAISGIFGILFDFFGMIISALLWLWGRSLYILLIVGVIFYAYSYLFPPTSYEPFMNYDDENQRLGDENNSIQPSNVEIRDLSIYPTFNTFNYVLRENHDSIKFTVYKGLNDYLAGIPRSYYCDPVCPSDRELELRYLNQKEQNKYLKNLVDIIKSKTSDPNEQARIAISLVQNIPYDYEVYKIKDRDERFPYQVLYDKKGVCGEKSKLLAYILKELGFGVSLFSFEAENHMAVGIKCPSQYSYKDSGYCFIEAANPAIPTYSEGDYVGAGKLRSTPEIIKISDGMSFDCLEEYTDAQDWSLLIDRNNLNQDEYNRYLFLKDKYGLKTTQNDDVDYEHRGVIYYG